MLFNLFPVLLFLAGVFSLLLSFYVLNERVTTIGKTFSLFAGAISIYSVGYGFELLSATLGEMLFWSKVQYLGIASIPGLILVLVILYTGGRAFFTWPRMILVFTIPLITLLARLTNEFHHLLYTSVGIDASGPGPLLEFTPGPLYRLHDFYSNFVLLVCGFLLIRFLFRAAPSYRKQTFILLIAMGIQWAGYLVYLAGGGPENLDINPLLLVLSAPVYALGIFKYFLFNLVPVARDRVFEVIKDGVMVVDKARRLVDYNKQCGKIIPEISKDKIGTGIMDLLGGYPWIHEIFNHAYPESTDISIGEKPDAMSFQLSNQVLFDTKGKNMGNILIFSNVTKERKLVKRLENMATTDELTGIYNRRHLITLAEREIARTGRLNRPVSILLMDLDHFKRINDTYGHHCGDGVLRHFTRLISDNIRNIDIFGRYGGEEFVLLLPETDGQNGLETAKRLGSIVADTPFLSGDHTLDEAVAFTVSIGVSSTTGPGTGGIDTLLKNADKALYRCKTRGRNQAALFQRSPE